VTTIRDSLRPRVGDVVRLLVSWAAATIALIIAGALMPGLSADHWYDYAIAALAAGIVGAIVRPVLVTVAARIGWIAVFALAIFGQAVILQAAIIATPGIGDKSFGVTLAASWIASTVSTVLSWIATAGTDEAFAASLIRRSKSRSADLADAEIDGVLFVQLDGVPLPVLSWALQSGLLPTLGRWLRDGSHRLEEWAPQIPCTTPASQLGILHGTIDGIPAFRWYDRELGRVVVANRPKDAALIESRAEGPGLLADDGISVSNLFSGGAPRSAMSMSRLSASRGSPTTRRAIAWYLARPDGFARSLARTIAELVKERHQSARQRRRDLRPRVHRGWTFAILRAVSNGVLRDLNTAVVCDEMMRGTKAIYVDYVDYDEIAHHAGMFRPESLNALEDIDGVLGVLERAAEVAARKYWIVVLSDHGQSQGTTFADAFDIDLAALCSSLADESVTAIDEPVESWGRTESLLDDMSKRSSPRLVGGAARKVRDKVDESAASNDGDEMVVLGSGNLGLIYATSPDRLSREEIDARWPALIPGLAAHPGIGFVAAMGVGGAQAIGADGVHWLDTGEVDGVDPMAPYGPFAAAQLRRAVRMHNAPDLYVNSAVDPTTLEVGAFEPLVGSHGGLGGWQDRAVFIPPTALRSSGEQVHGADELHNVLVGFLEHLGHRADVKARPTASEPDSTDRSDRSTDHSDAQVRSDAEEE
jgi:uncharacterized membrane protein YvlD (DUF360 family)